MNGLMQAVLAIVGLAVSAVLGYGTYVNDRRESEQDLIQFYSELIRDLDVKECTPRNATFLDLADRAATKLRDTYNDATYADQLTNVAAEFALRCSQALEIDSEAEEQLNRDLAAAPEVMTDDPVVAGPPLARIQEGSLDTYSDYLLQQSLREQALVQTQSWAMPSEIAQAAEVESGRVAWRTVLGTFVIGRGEEDALATAQRLAGSRVTLPEGWSVQVYARRATRRYAVVLEGADQTKDGADARAVWAEDRGLVDEAFVQRDLSWRRCGDAGELDLDDLRACGGRSAN